MMQHLLKLDAHLATRLRAYLEGSTIPPRHARALAECFQAQPSEYPVYRTLRVNKYHFHAHASINFAKQITSASLTKEASLRAALSFAHDMNLKCKYFVTYEFAQIKVLCDHDYLTAFLESQIPKAVRCKHELRRLRKEQEVWVAPGRYIGKLIRVLGFEAADKHNWPKLIRTWPDY